MQSQPGREYRYCGFDAWRSLWHSVALSVVLPSILAGCAMRKPSPPAEPPRSVKAAAVDSPSTVLGAGASPYQPGEVRYDVQVLSIVQALGGDSTHHADSSRVSGSLAATFIDGPGRNAATAYVQADSLSLTAGSGTSVPIPTSGRFIFTIDMRTGQVRSSGRDTAQDCPQASPESPPFYGREVIPAILPEVDTWNDTLQTSACRGGALLSIRRIASYKRAQSANPAPQLLRSTQFRITGSGYQWGQKIEVSGEGTATDTLQLGGVPLRLQDVHGSSQATLIFRAPLRIQEFTQATTTRITLRRP